MNLSNTNVIRPPLCTCGLFPSALVINQRLLSINMNTKHTLIQVYKLKPLGYISKWNKASMVLIHLPSHLLYTCRCGSCLRPNSLTMTAICLILCVLCYRTVLPQETVQLSDARQYIGDILPLGVVEGHTSCM